MKTLTELEIKLLIDIGNRLYESGNMSPTEILEYLEDYYDLGHLPTYSSSKILKALEK